MAEPASGRIAIGRYDRSVGNFVVYLVDANGTAESWLLAGGHECPRWSPDGQDIALTPLGVFEHAGQPDGTYLVLPFTDPTLQLGCSIWSPDGSRLAFEGWDDTDLARNGIYTLNAVDGSDLQRLTSSPDGAHDIPGDYSADGSQRFLVQWKGREDGPIMVVGADGSPPWQLTSETYGVPSLSADGQTLLAGSNGKLYLIAVDGSSATPITIPNTTADAFGPSWSPDGSWIVFSLATPSGTADIARVRPDGSGLFQITHDPANDEFADWSPW